MWRCPDGLQMRQLSPKEPHGLWSRNAVSEMGRPYSGALLLPATQLGSKQGSMTAGMRGHQASDCSSTRELLLEIYRSLRDKLQ